MLATAATAEAVMLNVDWLLFENGKLMTGSEIVVSRECVVLEK